MLYPYVQYKPGNHGASVQALVSSDGTQVKSKKASFQTATERTPNNCNAVCSFHYVNFHLKLPRQTEISLKLTNVHACTNHHHAAIF